MSETPEPVEDQADNAAEKAYATAAKAIRVKAAEPAPVIKPASVAKPVKAKVPATKAPKAVAAQIAKTVPAPAPRTVKAALAVKRPPAVKPPAVAATAPKIAAKPTFKKTAPSARPTAVTPAAFSKISTAPQLKEKTMDMSSKFTDGFKTIAADAQEKAKEFYTKGSAFFGEAGEFTKGNVQAVVASGKILVSGMKDIGDTLVADTKEAIETISADVKQVASVKSPTELVKLQSDLMQRNLDKFVAYNSKATETMLKLTTAVMAPVSARVSLAVEKVRNVA